MAEEQGSGSPTTAGTAEQSAEQPIERPSDSYTPEELRQLIREENAGFWQTVDRRIGNVEQLRPQLEEVIGSSRNTEAMVKRVFAGIATEEDKRDYEEANKLQAAEMAKTRAEAEAKALREGQTTPQQFAERDFQIAQQRTARLAARNGLNWNEIGNEVMAIVVDRTPSDPFAVQAWETAAEDWVIKEADKRLKAAKIPPRTPEARPVGAPEGTDSISLFKSGLEKRRK